MERPGHESLRELQIYELKKANRHLKVLLSIGGWMYSPHFHPVVVNAELRRKLVESSLKILEGVRA